MEKEYLERMIEERVSVQEISRRENKCYSTIQYWINKYELKSIFNNFKGNKRFCMNGERKCPKCEKMVRIENFNNKNGIMGSSSYCKKCATEQSLSRMRKLKQQMVDYKGGCCQKCGYDKYFGALEFHHLNPDEKDFNPSHYRKYTFDERVKNELDKCILLCSNCHRETHFEINERKRELR